MSKFNVWLNVQGKTLSRDKITRSFRIYQRKTAHKSVKIIPKNIGIHPSETMDNRMTELCFKVSFSSRFVWNWERIPLKLLLSVLSPTQNIVLELGTNIVKGVAICTVPNIEHRFGIRNEYRESCCYLYCPQHRTSLWKSLLSVLSPTQNIVLELGTNIVKVVAISTVPNIEHRCESRCYLYCPQHRTSFWN